jgi:hypothetical protein
MHLCSGRPEVWFGYIVGSPGQSPRLKPGHLQRIAGRENSRGVDSERGFVEQ